MDILQHPLEDFLIKSTLVGTLKSFFQQALSSLMPSARLISLEDRQVSQYAAAKFPAPPQRSERMYRRMAAFTAMLCILFRPVAYGESLREPLQVTASPANRDEATFGAQAEPRPAFAVVRMDNRQKTLQSYRLRVGGEVFDFGRLVNLRPADTDNATVRILHDFDFKHPGVLSSLKELEFIKQKIADSEEPWATEFERMKTSRFADRDYLKKMAEPPAVVSSDFSGKGDQGFAQEMKDANAAYTQALMWYFTHDVIYAKNAAGILETYAKTVTSHLGRNWYLEVAWAGSVFPLSAELLRATYRPWDGQRMIAKWFNDVFLPPLHQRVAFGNREFAVINALAAIGVYNEDPAAFYLAINHWLNYVPAYHYLSEDGSTPYLPDYWTQEVTPSDEFLLRLNEARFPKDWTPWITLHRELWNAELIHGKLGDDTTAMRKSVADRDPSVVWVGAPLTYVNGYTAETARDLAHVEESFAAEINVAEIAWHQGIDIYTSQAKRLTAFMETDAKLRLGEPPPESMTAQLTADGLVKTFEIAYNHYAKRMRIQLPYMQQILLILRETGAEAIRPIGLARSGGERANTNLWRYRPPIPPLFASNIGGSVGWISSWETLTHAELGSR